MSYAIGEIVYGIDLTESGGYGPDKAFDEFAGEISDLRDIERVGGAYSGSGIAPRWVGPQITSIDECDNVRFLEVVKSAEVTEAHKAEFQRQLNELLDADDVSDEFKAALRAAEPDVWLLWGSS